MWIAYWNFAFANKEYYQVMFGVQMNCCCDVMENLPEAQLLWKLFSTSIGEGMQIEDTDSDIICTKYYTFWSVVHGLISINLSSLGSSDETNKQVLKDAIGGIITSIKK